MRSESKALSVPTEVNVASLRFVVDAGAQNAALGLCAHNMQHSCFGARLSNTSQQAGAVHTDEYVDLLGGNTSRTG